MSKQVQKRVNQKTKYYLISISSGVQPKIFKNTDDYQFFLSLFKYLLPTKESSLIGSTFTSYSKNIFPLAYALNPTDCELLVRCKSEGGVTNFVDDLMSLYAAYFFDKYEDKLDDDYEITAVDESDLLRVSRLVHTRPDDWRASPHSSLRAFMYDDGYDWLDCNFIKSFGYSTGDYLRYLES
ncbi:MAG TPA: hypothetical protein PKC86_00450 [Candidatus Saccharibacteria bacterium]|nr:hypothetical protein [Candidatus Saccharibacteria bacterium]HRN97070.1 hypothetical protein [Candidatus Saccharibacteria bacterium]HRQ07047.1 hypothetical protein [Candidatus Saccharibacteria bacterium]